MNRTQMPNAQIISLQIAAIIFSSSLEMRSQHISFFTFPFISHFAISHWPCSVRPISPNYRLISQFLLLALISLSLCRNYASESRTLHKPSLIFYGIFLSLLTVKYLTGKFATIFHQNYMEMHSDLNRQAHGEWERERRKTKAKRRRNWRAKFTSIKWAYSRNCNIFCQKCWYLVTNNII